jgi:hypothetical protein
MEAPELDKTLDSLCEAFETEAERQELLLAAVRAQAEAALARDVALLEERTAAVSALLRETVEAETTRLELVRGVVDHYGLPPEQQTLSALIAETPEPWRGRMAEFQRRMKAVLADTRRAVGKNQAILRQAVRGTALALDAVSGNASGMAATYDAQGARGKRTETGPAMLNRQG